MSKPSPIQVNSFQWLYDHFNEELFNSSLPDVMLNFSRRKGMVSFFKAKEWYDYEEDEHGEEMMRDEYGEISLNPDKLDKEPLVTCSYIVREMVHVWQSLYGVPSKCKGYHNKEWANEMMRVGLTPVSQDKPGKQTGMKVFHTIEFDGKYSTVFSKIPPRKYLPFKTTVPIREELKAQMILESINKKREEEGEEPLEELIEFEERNGLVINMAGIEEKRHDNAKNKFTYQCPGCHTKVWGKDGIDLICGACQCGYEIVG